MVITIRNQIHKFNLLSYKILVLVKWTQHAELSARLFKILISVRYSMLVCYDNTISALIMSWERKIPFLPDKFIHRFVTPLRHNHKQHHTHSWHIFLLYIWCVWGIFNDLITILMPLELELNWIKMMEQQKLIIMYIYTQTK